MNEIKLSVSVNIDFSESTKSFLNEMFSCGIKPTAKQEAKPAAKPTAQAQASKPEAKPTAQAQAKASKPETAETTKDASSISIDDVRKALSLKVNAHRGEIKDKLNELGAPSVTKLDTSKYKEMYDFLNSLD